MDKNTKNDIKVVKGDNDAKLTIDDKITIKELEDQIKSMKKDKEAKCKSAKEQLVDMLDVTVDKYRTATGTAEALRVLRFTNGDRDVRIVDAIDLAHQMAEEALAMRDKADSLSYAEMDQVCDGFYEKDFECDDRFADSAHARALAFEMMRIDLCRNVGSSAEDMVEFVKRVQDEIDKTGEKLKELRVKEAK